MVVMAKVVEDNPGDTPGDVVENTPGDVVENTPSDVIEDILSDVIEDTPSDIIEDGNPSKGGGKKQESKTVQNAIILFKLGALKRRRREDKERKEKIKEARGASDDVNMVGLKRRRIKKSSFSLTCCGMCPTTCKKNNEYYYSSNNNVATDAAAPVTQRVRPWTSVTSAVIRRISTGRRNNPESLFRTGWNSENPTRTNILNSQNCIPLLLKTIGMEQVTSALRLIRLLLSKTMCCRGNTNDECENSLRNNNTNTISEKKRIVIDIVATTLIVTTLATTIFLLFPLLV